MDMSERIIPQAWKERVEELKGEINWDKFQKQVTNGISSASRDIANFLKTSGLVNRTIGMDNSVETYGYIIQALGYEPMSLLGKDFAFIFDTMRRNSYRSDESSNGTDMWNRFTYYEGKPSIRFADVYLDSSRYNGNWKPEMEFSKTRDFYTNYVYAESEGYGVSQGTHLTETEKNEDTYTQKFKSFTLNFGGVAKNDLIKKTNDLFNAGRMRTMIARFYEKNAEYGPTQTALSQMFGMSHGRNLLNKGGNKEHIQDVYDNPYCRVWTNYHQYRSLKDTIRPLQGNPQQDAFDGKYHWDALRAPSGNTRLLQNSVLDDKNGLVKITPYENDRSTGIYNIKRCMFSIENLAWREQGRIYGTYDDDGLSPEQKGPFGGRIMWFPPYNLTFDEQVSVNWDSSEFIGRGEKVYTYKNSDRTGRLSFTMLIDHPGIVDYWDKRGDKKEESRSYDEYGCINANSNESELLRFFAGCDVLTAKPQKPNDVSFNQSNLNAPAAQEQGKEAANSSKNAPAQNPDEEPDPNPNGTITFKVVAYFPNNYSGVNDEPEAAIQYLLNGVGTQVGENNQDIPFNMSVRPEYKSDGVWKSCGGYEMCDKGISIQTSQITGGHEYDDENNVEYFRLNQTENLEIRYKDKESKLVKKTYKGCSHDWDNGAIGASGYPKFYQEKYFTRADEKTLVQILSPATNYMDRKSYYFNSTGYTKGAEIIGFHDDKSSKDEILISLIDLYVALYGDDSNTFKDYTGSSENNIAILKQLINGKNKSVKISSLDCCGSYSPVATSKRSKKNQDPLAKQRSATLYNWLIQKLQLNNNTNYKDNGGKPISGLSVTEEQIKNVDDQVMKACRSARAEITFSNVSDEIISQISPGQAQGVKSSQLQTQPAPASPNTGQNNGNTPSTKNQISRYDNEALFFKRLEKDDPFLHHLITEKIKYFDPAFHSISPEGFGARLTFLHQCTRQGPTQGTSDFGGIANNLAFGRPPVCILRIGDFYYTKIVITNLSIDYKDASWDLNQEGIGVMPMMANISISFAFLGGSDLTGPISRLQNALSFNYYANTTVYDNRAERVEYDENGEVTSFKAYFGMENKKDNNKKQ